MKFGSGASGLEIVHEGKLMDVVDKDDNPRNGNYKEKRIEGKYIIVL